MQHLKKLIYGTMLLGFVLFAPINVFAFPNSDGGSSDGANQDSSTPDCQYQAQVTAEEHAQSAKNFEETFEQTTDGSVDIGPVQGGEELAPQRPSPSGPRHENVTANSQEECNTQYTNTNDVIYHCTVEAVDGFTLVQDYLEEGKPEQFTEGAINGERGLGEGIFLGRTRIIHNNRG